MGHEFEQVLWNISVLDIFCSKLWNTFDSSIFTQNVGF